MTHFEDVAALPGQIPSLPWSRMILIFSILAFSRIFRISQLLQLMIPLLMASPTFNVLHWKGSLRMSYGKST